MKKILFPIIALLTLLVISCGSSKETDYRNRYTDEVLDGIFKLRLGMSEAELRAVVDTSSFDTSNFLRMGRNKSRDIHSAFGRIKHIDLKEYIPASGYTIKDIKLDFFDGKLYRIRIERYNEELKKLLTEKYGKPKEKVDKGTHIEWKTNAEKIGEWDNIKSKTKYYNIYTTWKTNDKDITCKSEYVDHYELELENKAVELEIKQIERNWFNNKNKDQRGEKKTKEQLLDEL